MNNTVTVIGAGLAGPEAAGQLAQRGIQVKLPGGFGACQARADHFYCHSYASAFFFAFGAVVFFAAVFFAAGFLASVFLAADFFSAVFFAPVFLAAGFFSAGSFAPGSPAGSPSVPSAAVFFL